jgi:hypothetical protein
MCYRVARATTVPMADSPSTVPLDYWRPIQDWPEMTDIGKLVSCIYLD